MTDSDIEAEVCDRLSRDREIGRYCLILGLSGLFGPLFCALFPTVGTAVGGWLYWLGWPIGLSSVASLVAAGNLLDPARKNVLENRIRSRASQRR